MTYIPTESDVRKWLELEGYHHSYGECSWWIEIVVEFAKHALKRQKEENTR